MQPAEGKTFCFEGFRLDLRRGCLRGERGEIELRPKSFEVLRYLVENAGRLIPKDEIMEAIWPDVVATDESLARCVSDVRLALGDREQRIIRTVPRRGYLLDVAVSAVQAHAGRARPQTHLPPPPERTSIDGALPSEAPSGERRPLTILSCEWDGLAALSARLDPEDFKVALAVCRDHCAGIVRRHEGRLVRFNEEGLLAYFGYARAEENDAERAVRAGLALIGSLAQLSARLGTPVQCRIGAATGVVVAGDEIDASGNAEVVAVGEAPYLARQLQSAAETDTLSVDPATRRLLGGLFECQALEFRSLEGYPDGLTAWRVLKASDVASRFDARRAGESGLTPFVGRARELEVLANGVLGSSARAKVIDIVGEAGIGKSRLLHEYRRQLAGSGARIWSGNCWPGDEEVPFRPFIEVMRRAFRLGPSEPEAEMVRKLKAGLALVDLAIEENLGLLLNLLGLASSPGALGALDDVLVGSRTRDLLLDLVRKGSRSAPVVVLLEDLHWIDHASQDLLARLIAMDVPGLTILHTRRPDYLPPWADAASTITLPLAPLAAAEASEIVKTRLGLQEIPPALASLISDRVEGNPLFAEEIANFLSEREMIRPGPSGLEYDAAAVAAAVPTSIHSLLTARADRLLAADRALLQAAAVIGRRFAPDLLAAVTCSKHVEARLMAMEQLDLVRLDENAEEFIFKHALVRDALYAALLSNTRKALHLAIAAEIERRNPGRASEVAEVLAHHYSRTDRRDKAVEYLALVGRKSVRIYSLEEAEHALEQALGLVRADDRERMDAQIAGIMVDLALVYYLQFKPNKTTALIEPELGRIETLGEIPQVPILLDLYGHALFSSCRYPEGRRIENKALAIAERLGDPRAKAHARAGVILLSIYVDPMPLEEFEQFAERAFAEVENSGERYLVARMMMAIGLNYQHRGLAREGQRWAYRLLKLGRERQDRRSQGGALWLLGWLAILSGDFASALHYGEECLQISATPFDRQMGHHVVGTSQLFLGRIAEGTATVEKNWRRARATGSDSTILTTECALGVSMLMSGKLKQGVRLLESTIERAESVYHFHAYADWTRIALAEFYLALLTGGRRLPVRTALTQPLFLVRARRVAARTAELLLQRALRNPLFAVKGVVRARIDCDLGLLYRALGRHDVARAHFLAASEAAAAQEASALIARIEAARAGRVAVLAR